MKKSLLLLGTTLSLLLVLSACGNGESPENTSEIETKNEQQVDTEEKGNQGIPNEEPDNTSQNQTIAAHEFFEPFNGKVDHIHGLGYAGNQNAIFFAAHDGIKVYEAGKWFKTKDLNNDYMGFSAIDQGFYTSGHPGPDVNLPNPLGLQRSFDNGQTLETLGMEGESDFHAMGVGYNNHTVYLLNEMKSKTLGLGLYVSKDDSENWEEINIDEIGDNILNIAVHPTNGDIFAIASQNGIYLSKDMGESFSLLTTNKQGISVFFSEDTLWYGAYGNEGPELIKYLLENESKEEITLPQMGQDAVMYLAENPQNKSEVAFVTYNGNIYLSEDGATTWELLVKEGKIQ